MAGCLHRRIHALLSIFALLFSPLVWGQTVLPEAFQVYPNTLYDWEMHAQADVDNDGDLDVLAGTTNPTGTLFLFHNDGAGNFIPQHNAIVAEDLYGLRQLLFADLNNDGWPELVVRTINNTLVFNNAEGNFEDYTAWDVQTKGLRFADLDGDQDLDLVYWNSPSYFENHLEVQLNDGAGNFTALSTITLDGEVMQGFEIADFDNDGDLDVLAAETDLGIVVLLNDGSAAFGPPQLIDPLRDTTTLFAVGDLNNDGDLDLVTCVQDLTLGYINQGDYVNYEVVEIFSSSDDPRNISLLDVTGNGYLDVLVACQDDPRLVAYRNQEGNFYGNYTSLLEDVYPSWATIGDYDLDGDLDALSSGTTKGKLLASFQVAVGEWEGHAICKAPQGSAAGAVLIHANDDPYPDMVVDLGLYDDDAQVEVLLGYGNEVMANHTVVTALADPEDDYQGLTMASGDADGDGLEDFVLKKDTWHHTLVRRTGSTYQIWQELSEGGAQTRPEFRDINGNGRDEVLLHSLYSTNPSLHIYRTIPGGEVAVHTPDQDGSNISWTADINGDGLLDLLELPSLGPLGFRLNLSGFEFEPERTTISPLLERISHIQELDLDADGDLDLIAIRQEVEKVFFLACFNPGDIDQAWSVSTFACAENRQLRELEVIDLDGDGIQDVVCANEKESGGINFGSEILYFRRYLGGFHPGVPLGDIEDPDYSHIFEARDWNGDGSKDLIVGRISSSSDGLYVYLTEPEAYQNAGCTDPEACNYAEWATQDSGSCCYNCGCTQACATNYDPSADCDNGSCTYDTGCTDESASNYNPDIVMDDGSCTYLFSGVVWDDLNPDGVQQEDEIGLAFRTIHIPTADLTLITDDMGYFEVELQGLDHFFVPITDPVFPYITQNNANPTSAITLDQGIRIGLSKDVPLYEVCIDFYPNGLGGLCNVYKNFNICFRNMSNVPIDGVIAVEYDPLYQGYSAVTPIDSAVGNVLYMSFEDLPSGQMYFYDVELLVPTTDFIGEWLTSQVNIWGYDEYGTLVASGEQTLTEEVTCAYDPNDKQAFPLGYGDDHRLLDGTEQEFLVRFQNTGNAPAQNVVIRDTLDVHFDLSTFQLVANSHSVQTVLDATSREVVFTFADIQLPDSTCCEEDSHGLVSYRIKPTSGLAPETRLENTAYIYFDNNDPIVTNTTWTTIHACQEALGFSSGLTEECPINAPYIQSDYIAYSGLEGDFYWTGDAGVLGLEPVLQLPAHYLGDIQLTVDNPLCTAMASTSWTDNGTYWFTCPGDLDCDGVIGVSDLQEILVLFGCDGSTCPFELTGDGAITSEDMLLVLSTFGMACP